MYDGYTMNSPRITYADQERFAFIERCLFWRGRVKREDLRQRFGLSESAANLTFRAYHEARPGAMTYAHAMKTYVPGKEFIPEFYVPDIGDCELDHVEAVIPTPAIRRETLDGLARALREHRAIKIEYTSLKGEQTTRTVEPLALVKLSAPFPPQLFGYCRLRGAGRNFDLSRMRVIALGSEVIERRNVDLEVGSLSVPVGAALPLAAELMAQVAFGGKHITVRMPRSALYAVTGTIISLPELRTKAAEESFTAMLRSLEASFSIE